MAKRSLGRREFLKLGAVVGAAGPLVDMFAGSRRAAAAALPEERKVREFELIISTADYDPVRYEYGLMTAANWRKLGFAVKVTPMEFTRLAQVCNVEHNFDTYTLNMSGRSERIDPDFMIYMLMHSSQVNRGQQNRSGYKSAEYDKYAELQRVTMNREERRKAVWKCQELYVRDQPQTPIVTRNR